MAQQTCSWTPLQAPSFRFSLTNCTFKITNFFNYMAFKADLTNIEVEKKANGRAYHAGAEFQPMRRKMAVPLD